MEIEINKEFGEILDFLENSDKSVLIVGKAGTGKSTLLRYFREKTKKELVVLAPTGVAAINVEGETIHAFAKFKADVLVEEAREMGKKVGGKRRKLIENLEMIIIDEISMVRADLMDCLNVYLQGARKNSQAFGGIRMIMIGDLYQLPPVIRGGEEGAAIRRVYKSGYFYEAEAISMLDFEVKELQKIYRQNDGGFVEILNAIRNKSFNEEHLKKLNQQVGLAGVDDSYIFLTARNDQAETINRENLEKLPGKTKRFRAETMGEMKRGDFPTEEILELKVGARVMLVNNNREGKWVNGSLGKIVEMIDDKVKVKLDDGQKVTVGQNVWEVFKTVYDEKNKRLDREVVGSFVQLPIRLAWAITIHKSQGKTFDKVVVDLGSSAFAQGQTYVALSRCRTLEGIRLARAVRASDVRVNFGVMKFLTQWQYSQAAQKNLAENVSVETVLRQTAKEKGRVKIVYLKAKDQRSERVIEPKRVGIMEYLGVEFLGVEAYCHQAGEMRVFSVKRILEIERIEL